MRLSNLADYAVVLMSAAARQCGSVPLHAALLAEQTGIPGPTAQKLVSGLARAGLLVASRGPRRRSTSPRSSRRSRARSR
jgi:DNA-binding IscR family transcriptional regulator